MTHVAQSVKSHAVYLGAEMPTLKRTVASNAATDRYAPKGSSSSTVAVAATTTTSGTLAADIPGSTNQSAAVTWTPGTFTTPVDIALDPAPPAATNALFVGVPGQQVVAVTVTDPKTGQAVHQLAAPIDIQFKNPPAGFVPMVSEDGTTYRPLSLISGPPLPDGVADAYYVAADGSIHILSRHVTIFAVMFKGNATVSESSRKLPQAGSGLFGDPTRNHSGAPKLQRVGSGTITAQTSGGVARVPLTFFVDEQASTYMSIVGANGQPIVLMKSDSVFRGTKLTGDKTRSIHVTILRPSTIKVDLAARAAGLQAGKTYKLRVAAVDFDGHKTVSFVPFKA